MQRSVQTRRADLRGHDAPTDLLDENRPVTVAGDGRVRRSWKRQRSEGAAFSGRHLHAAVLAVDQHLPGLQQCFSNRGGGCAGVMGDGEDPGRSAVVRHSDEPDVAGSSRSIGRYVIRRGGRSHDGARAVQRSPGNVRIRNVRAGGERPRVANRDRVPVL